MNIAELEDEIEDFIRELIYVYDGFHNKKDFEKDREISRLVHMFKEIFIKLKEDKLETGGGKI